MQKDDDSSIININNIEEFNTVIEHGKTNNLFILLDATAKWCNPCRFIAPYYNSLSKDTQFNDFVVFTKVDIDEASDVADLLKISSIPCFILYHQGEEIDRIQGTDITLVKKKINENKKKFIT